MTPATRRRTFAGLPISRWALPGAVALLVGWALFGFPHPMPTTVGEVAGPSETLGAWTYLIAGALAFLEVGTPLGLAAPLELAVPFAGAATATGPTSLPALIGVVWICAAAGDSVGFLAGSFSAAASSSVTDTAFASPRSGCTASITTSNTTAKPPSCSAASAHSFEP